MNIKQKVELTFGEWATAAFAAWKARRAKMMVRGAVNARVMISSKAAALFDFFRQGALRMNGPVDQIKIALGIALLACLMGCVGYVDGGYGGTVVVPGPPVLLFGGGYERGRDVHEYSRRGVESRVAVRPARGGEERRR
jgi:hypothetical protein